MLFLNYLLLIVSIFLQTQVWGCPYSYRVCGTDGKTYSNICQFNIAKAGDRDLQILHEGFCLINLTQNESPYKDIDPTDRSSKLKLSKKDELIPVYIADERKKKILYRCHKKCSKVCGKNFDYVRNVIYLTTSCMTCCLRT